MRPLVARLDEIAACPDCKIVPKFGHNDVQICPAHEAKFKAEPDDYCRTCLGTGIDSFVEGELRFSFPCPKCNEEGEVA